MLENEYPAHVVFHVGSPTKRPTSVKEYPPPGSLVANPAATILLLIACAEYQILLPSSVAVSLFP